MSSRRMRFSWITFPAGILLAGLALTGCSGLESWSDFDPAKADEIRAYETWDWAPFEGEKAGDIRSNDRLVDDPMTDRRIRSSVEAKLAEKGLRRTEGGSPDFRIGYHVSIDGRMDVTYINSYYGYGWGGYWGPYGPSFGMGYSTPSVRQYNEGTLILDIVDGSSNELVWRGVVSGEVHEKRDAQERQEAIDRAIGEALKDFPPGG
ncbi:MAG: DUF4136 domain-containing protein [marine benthic group bacterium]|nr:DUF4136 domain-containing protein [Candidatus Carthagonibacter metallireducens]MCL7975142.1 DUF4136 domain-containing protein [Gemmatimonadota bacterium]